MTIRTRSPLRRVCAAIAAALLCAASSAYAGTAYTQLEYIASTNTQYINTGLSVTENTRMVCDFQFTATPTTTARNGWCGSGAGSSVGFYFGANFRDAGGNWGTSGTLLFASSCGTTLASGFPMYSPSAFDLDRHTFDIAKGSQKFDGAEFATDNTLATFSNNTIGNIYLFAGQQAWGGRAVAYPCSMKIFSCKIYEGDTLVRDFVPARRNDNSLLGLYDLANRKFYTNNGKGVFLAGADVVDIPDTYQLLEYIESTGKQYIDTGIVANDRTGFSVTYACMVASHSANITPVCGCMRQSGTDTRFFVLSCGTEQLAGISSSCIIADWNGLSPIQGNISPAAGGRYFFDYWEDVGRVTVEMNYGNDRKVRVLDRNGDLAKDVTGTLDGEFAITEPLAAHTETFFLFLHDVAGTASTASSRQRIYSFTMTTNGNVVARDMVPVRRNGDSVLGMYDKVERKFYPNEGSGSFIAGNRTPYTINANGDFVPVPAADYYAIGTTLEAAGQSSISGTGGASGWASTQGSTTVAVRGVTEPNATYHVWRNAENRTPENTSYATPEATAIVVEPGVRWRLANKLGAHRLTLNNVTLREGAVCAFDETAGGYVSCDNYIDGSFAISNGASLKIDCAGVLENGYQRRLIGNLAANVTGTGAIAMFNNIFSGNKYPEMDYTPRITGDISGFTGDLVAYNGATNGTTFFSLELVNASSIPGDPAAGRTARVVVTNGAQLVVNHDWNSPENRVWDFGDGRRPIIYVAAGKTVTINGNILGSSGLVKAGQGTLVLKKRGSFFGACDVVGGKVRLEGRATALASYFRRKEDIALPAGYTMLENLSLAGGAQDSYIDTGYTPTSGAFGFLFDYTLKAALAGNSGGRVMGSTIRNGGQWDGLILTTWVNNGQLASASGQFSFGGHTTGRLFTLSGAANGGQAAFERMRLSFMGGYADLSRGWHQAVDLTTPTGFHGNIYIGNANCDTMAAGWGPIDVYRYMIFEREVLVHDFVPVRRASDGAVGLYDVVGDLGFRPAADAQYVSAGLAYSGSDKEWLEVEPPSATFILLR